MRRSLLVLSLACATACATSPAPRITTAADLGWDAPVLRATTALEVEAAADSPRDGKERSPALFWTGTVAGIVGTVGFAGFGIAGRVAKNNVIDGYADGLSQSEFDDLDRRGTTWNTLSYTSAAVAAVGWALAIIVYGVDYSRCGPMAPKKRKCGETR